MILQMTFIRQANLFVLFLGTMHGDAHTLRGGEMPMDGLPKCINQYCGEQTQYGCRQSA